MLPDDLPTVKDGMQLAEVIVEPWLESLTLSKAETLMNLLDSGKLQKNLDFLSKQLCMFINEYAALDKQRVRINQAQLVIRAVMNKSYQSYCKMEDGKLDHQKMVKKLVAVVAVKKLEAKKPDMMD